MAQEAAMVKTEIKKNILLAGWLLAVSALIGTGLMSVVNWHSKPYIAENERLVLLRTLNSVIAPDSYDNDILNDTIRVSDKKLLGSKDPIIVYRARSSGKPVAAVLTVIAPKGYNGDIVILVGIQYSGEITAVRVVNHRETPGLGDAIEIQRSNWIDVFTGKSSLNPTNTGWKVKRDGGEFDQFTGATITPRAIVDAVHKALLYFEQNKEQLFTISNTVANKELEN